MAALDPSEDVRDGGEPAEIERVSTLPGPDGLPLVGSTISIARDGLGFENRLREYGDLVTYRAFGQTFVVVYDPEIVETVLVSRNEAFEKGDFEQGLGDIVAPEGLAFTEGDQWRRQRLALQSSFTPDRIETYAEAMVGATASMVDEWENGSVVELQDAFSTLTLRILTRALFDLELDSEGGAIVRRAAESIEGYIDNLGLLSILPEWVPTRTERRHERAMADLDDFVETLIEERRGDTDGRDDLLSLLVGADYPDGTTLTPAEVRDQLVTFLFAGHATTATALTYACWLVAGHPEIQDRLATEVEVLDGDPTVADLGNLAFTERVVRESLRLYPPIYAFYRQPREPVVLGGYRVDPTVTLQLPVYSLHRDGRYWSDPESFRPDRWRDRDDDRPEYAYFPFGGGPRHCIGMRFAMVELQLALATMVRHVEFERVTTDLDLSMGLTLDPGEVKMRVRRRKGGPPT